jgi:hypothetical protein
MGLGLGVGPQAWAYLVKAQAQPEPEVFWPHPVLGAWFDGFDAPGQSGLDGSKSGRSSSAVFSSWPLQGRFIR